VVGNLATVSAYAGAFLPCAISSRILVEGTTSGRAVSTQLRISRKDFMQQRSLTAARIDHALELRKVVCSHDAGNQTTQANSEFSPVGGWSI